MFFTDIDTKMTGANCQFNSGFVKLGLPLAGGLSTVGENEANE